MMRKISLSFLLLCTVWLKVTAQYHGDRPLEMTFEQSGMFFTSSYLNPFGTSHFGSASILLIDDPLVDIQRNPANLSRFDSDTLPSNLFYLDMRNNRETVQQHHHGIAYPLITYPRYGYYTSSRSELAPLISAAYLTRLPILSRNITLGATYQIITQGERYYDIPYDIYKNYAGRDLTGLAYEGMGDYNIVDRFSGADEMYHEGHALNAFLAWQVGENTSLGLKVGRFIFDREGSLGTNNLWNQQINRESYWKRWESREQDYNHWDFTLGVSHSIEDRHIGLYAGYLRGSVNQVMVGDDESMSKYGVAGSSNWSDYQSWHRSNKQWNHKGDTYYTGLALERQINDEVLFRFSWNFSMAQQNLALSSSIASESENEYYSQSSTHLRESNGFSTMQDLRTGSGERNQKSSSLQVGVSWQYQPNQAIRFGALYSSRSLNTQTNERADASSEWERYSYWESYSTGDISVWESYTRTIEDKSIIWDFDRRLRTFQVPIIFEYDYSKSFDFMLGINRSMNFWTVENSTLILYDYRERVINNETKVERNTGERITEPRERFSVVNTSFLGGVSISPAQTLSIQLLAAPGFERNSIYNNRIFGFQFWLAITLMLN